jgi:uncharacterized OB-fold protein
MERRSEGAERPTPVIHPETAFFWSSLASGELVVQRCTSCGTKRFPFAPVCFACGSLDSDWCPVPTEGTVKAAVRVHRATGERVWGEHVPFLAGLVDVEEGIRFTARISCTCGQGARPGARVTAIALVDGDGVAVLGFVHSCQGTS